MFANHHSFKVGQILEVEVVDVVSKKELIVNIDGQLLRVSNQSQRDINIGQKVKLYVQTLRPLSFSLEPKKQKDRIDLSI